MWDGESGQRVGRTEGPAWSSHRAQHEAGREAVCSRGQRRLTALVSSSFGPLFPCLAQVSGSSLLKCKASGQDWAPRPHLLPKEPGEAESRSL